MNIDDLLNNEIVVAVVVEALSKSIAQPVKRFLEFGDKYFCPHCKTILDSENKHNYCNECGQKIDWSTYEKGDT